MNPGEHQTSADAAPGPGAEPAEAGRWPQPGPGDAPGGWAPRPGGCDDVLFAIGDGTGQVLLNRPRAINSLSHAMVTDISATLLEWGTDPRVERIVVRGAGERGLCAGGDVKAAREAILAGDPDAAARFWADEYALFGLIARHPKPVEVSLNGIVMGGGLGLAMHARVRRVLPSARIAMPETGIGFFPDAGATRLLARSPGELGTYLALTGVAVGAEDALVLGLADSRHDGCGDAARESLTASPRTRSRPTTAEPRGADRAPLLADREWIDAAFAGDDPAVIIRRLERHTDPRALACAGLLRRRCPLSVAIALERIRRARHEPSLDDTLAVDAAVAAAMMQDSDFVEGVRASVIDKDTPRWRHTRIEDVPRGDVLGYFG